MKKPLVYASMAAAAVLLGVAALLAARMPQQQNAPQADRLQLEPLVAVQSLPREITLETKKDTNIYQYFEVSQRFGVMGYDAGLAFDQGKLQRLFGSMAALNTTGVVEEQPADLARYGLDDPAVVATASFPDGQTHVVRVGNPSPLEDGYYGMVDDRPQVYLLLSYDVDSLLRGLYDFRAPLLLPQLGAEAGEYAVELLELRLQRREQGELHLLRKQPESETSLVEPLWITQPVSVESDQFSVTETVVKGLFALMRATPVIVEDNPADLATYGLDQPETLYLRDSRVELTLLVGKTQDGRIYIMREGIPAVLSVEESLLAFFRVPYEQIMSRLVWLHNINDVANLLVEVDGVTYDLDTAQAAQGQFKLDGQPVPEAAGRAVFAAAIRLQLEQKLPPQEMPGQPACTLTALYKDGTRHTLSLIPLNERQVAYSVDGQPPAFYCPAKGMNEILSALQALL